MHSSERSKVEIENNKNRAKSTLVFLVAVRVRCCRPGPTQNIVLHSAGHSFQLNFTAFKHLCQRVRLSSVGVRTY